MDTISVLAAVLQGLLEWWPVSSTAVVTLFLIALGRSISEGYSIALALHLGSGLAIVLVFRNPFLRLLKEFAGDGGGGFIVNYLLALVISFTVALPLYFFFYNASPLIGWTTLLIVAAGLMATSIVPAKGVGLERDVKKIDWVTTGVLQGIAVLPGFSRKGLTIGYLLLRKYRPEACVTTSFMLGAPALIAAGLYESIKMLKTGVVDAFSLVVLQLIVFVFSVISAKTFLAISQRTDFRWFTLLLSLITVLTVIIQITVGE